jgi:hypothetical protein
MTDTDTDQTPPSELDRASLAHVVHFDLRVRAALDEFCQQQRPDLMLAIGTLNGLIGDAIAGMRCPRCREAALHFTRSRLATYVIENLRCKSPNFDELCNDHRPKAPA